MLKWALIFFVISIITGLLGFTGISAASAGIASRSAGRIMTRALSPTRPRITRSSRAPKPAARACRLP